MTGIEAVLVAQPAWVWVAVAAAFLVVELATGSGYLLWPAASAGVVALVLFFAPAISLIVQVLAFAALTVLTTFTARRWLPRRLHADEVSDLSNAAARIVGHEGEAAAEARVFVDGKEWAAESETPLAPGMRVKVLAVLGGARLKVRPV